MDTLVTGGTGFIGAHLVRALLQRGRAVRCLVRPGSSRANLEGLDVAIAEGDLLDAPSLRAALRGVDRVFHCAADYRLWAADQGAIYRANVDGTDHLMRAACAAGIERVVYTSSVAALGLRPDGLPGDEDTPVHYARVIGHYKRSKYLAERVVSGWVSRGLPAVIVNPSTPVGEHDIKPTPTGRIVVDFLRGRMRACVDTGLNVVDVRDVAEGHLLAEARGVVGRRYILGNRNLTLAELFALLARLTGLPAPRLRVPHWVPYGVALASEASARLLRRPPGLPLDAVRMARKRMFFDAGRAVRELGLPQTPVEIALGRAIAWYLERGYAPVPPGADALAAALPGQPR